MTVKFCDSDKGQSVSSWVDTLTNLLELARTASDGFNYERALNYLATMEELWESKALPDFSVELRSGLLGEKGRAFSKLGRYSEAVEQYEKLLKYYKDKGAFPKRAGVFLEMGQLLAKQGEFDRALGYVHRALAAYRQLEDPPGTCKSLRNLGVIYIELGEFEDAEMAYNEAIEIARKDNRQILFADLNNNLGAIRNMKGNWQGALDCYRVSCEVYEREGELRKAAYTSNNIGITFLEQGQYETALKTFISALKVAESIKDASLSLILSINLTDLYLKRNELEEAKRYCHNATQYLESEGLRNGQLVETKKLAGRIALEDRKYEPAREYFDDCLEICRELGLQYLEAEVLFEKGNLLFHTNQHMEALQMLESSFHLFSLLEAAGRIEKTEKLINSIEELYLKVFESMAFKVDQKDHYTKGHSDRVANLTLLLAQELHLKGSEIKALIGAALLHDIGKLDIADSILKKTGKLTAEEYGQIKQHPDLGVSRLSGMKFPWDIIPLIRYHHERYDGAGYPGGLAGELIPLGARIICVADVFDALTSERPYRYAFSPERALQIMKEEMGAAFDPLLLETLISLVGTGRTDQIINRHTRPDEMYQIWAQCRFKNPPEAVQSAAATPLSTSI